jgi:hypothetical protein
MKSLKTISIFLFSIALLLNSCTVEKRVHMPGYHIEWNHSKGNVSQNKSQSEDRITTEEQHQTAFQEDNAAEEQVILKSVQSENNVEPTPQNVTITPEISSTLSSVECDNIILKNGEAINAKVTEITDNEVKYKKCHNLNGPTYSVSKSEVSVIKYVNGTEETFPTDSSNPNKSSSKAKNANAKVEGFAIGGFIASIIGLFIAGIPLGLLAIIFGGISLARISNNQERFKGKGLAITAIVIGAIDVIAIMILLYLLF